MCEGKRMIIEHQFHSQNNTVPKYSLSESECGEVVLFGVD